jgi:glycosyltransferase involved in cell wall biosynthesis
MRIAVFGESYLPYLSGVTVSTETLARGLGAAGHEVLLAVPAPAAGHEPGSSGAQGPEPRMAWLPSYQLPVAPDGYRVPLPGPSAALAAVDAFRPEIVHAQSPFTSGIMARLAARRAGAPLVFTHHTQFADYAHYTGPFQGLTAAVSGHWLRAWWRGCQGIVAPSEDLATEIRGALGRRGGSRVRAIPTGVAVSSIAGLPEGHPRRESGWPMDSIVAVSVGRVALEKNVELLTDVLARSAADEPRLRLLLVGGGPATDAVLARARAAGVGDRLRVTGLLPRTDALELLRASDLFLFASQTETQGLVLAESLAAGVPVVALEGPGVADTVRSGTDGLVVAGDPEDTRARRLADAVITLASHPRRRARFAAQARSGADRLDVSHRIAEMVEFYRELRAT